MMVIDRFIPTHGRSVHLCFNLQHLYIYRFKLCRIRSNHLEIRKSPVISSSHHSIIPRLNVALLANDIRIRRSRVIQIIQGDDHTVQTLRHRYQHHLQSFLSRSFRKYRNLSILDAFQFEYNRYPAHTIDNNSVSNISSTASSGRMTTSWLPSYTTTLSDRCLHHTPGRCISRISTFHNMRFSPSSSPL